MLLRQVWLLLPMKSTTVHPTFPREYRHPSLLVRCAADHFLESLVIAEAWPVPELDPLQLALLKFHSFAFSALSFSMSIIPT